uniref:Putative secreted protein n=1 Tax=Ixodes ricinus TaxID=34613 RepID=A0A147BLA8_IXORI
MFVGSLLTGVTLCGAAPLNSRPCCSRPHAGLASHVRSLAILALGGWRRLWSLLLVRNFSTAARCKHGSNFELRTYREMKIVRVDR